MQRLTINIDVDGVIYDFNEHMTSFAEVKLGRKLPVTKSWDMAEAWGISEDDFFALFHDAIRTHNLFRDGNEIEGGPAAVRRLSNKHRVRLVTSKKLRHPESTMKAQIQTIRWLSQERILNQVELAFTGNKQGYQADVVIDDKPTLKWAQRGALNLLFGQPWNEDVSGEEYARPNRVITRVEGWDEVESQIEALAKVVPIQGNHNGHVGRGGG